VHDGRKHQLLTLGNPWVISYDPVSGKEFWRVHCMDGADAASSVVYAEGLAYAVSQQTRLFAIDANGTSNVTESHVRWSVDEGLPDITSPLTDGKHVWLLETGGALTCYDAKGGQKVYGHEFEKIFNASPTLAGDKLYLTTTKGVTYVVGAGPQYKLLHTSPLGEGVWASLAFQDGRIYVRGKKHLFCIAKGSAATSGPASAPAPESAPAPTQGPAQRGSLKCVASNQTAEVPRHTPRENCATRHTLNNPRLGSFGNPRFRAPADLSAAPPTAVKATLPSRDPNLSPHPKENRLLDHLIYVLYYQMFGVCQAPNGKKTTPRPLSYSIPVNIVRYNNQEPGALPREQPSTPMVGRR
jgi:hypothetical protein